MQRITKFSAFIGTLAVLAFAVGLFMYMPAMTGHSISLSPFAAFAWGDSGCGSGCSGGYNHSGENGGYHPPSQTPSPVCTLNAQPQTIDRGDSATLSWSTAYATSVVLNHGIGAVTRNGNISVSPVQTTTYTLTATGNGKTVTCAKTITVRIPVPEPVCTLNAQPLTIDRGDSAMLSWTTAHATTVHINQGIGAVNANGNTSVSPTQTTTYALIATGNGKTVTCAKTITVRIPVPEPVCTLNAHPQTIDRGDSATLSWTTSNANMVSINQGIGEVVKNGNSSVSPTHTTSYTLTAKGTSKTVQCVTTVYVRQVDENPSCDSFTASPSSFGRNGGTTDLDWNTTNADRVTINQGIGDVAFDGSESVFVGSSKTFTLTAWNGNKSDSCDVYVRVDNSTNNLSCDYFRVNDSSVNEGDEIELEWGTTDADQVSIDQGIGNVNDDGSETLRVYSDKTFTLTASADGDEVSCHVSVNVDENNNDNNPSPRCDAFTASDRSITEGDSVKLSWETTRGDTLTIEDEHGHDVVDITDDNDVDDGSVTVRPDEDTRYTLTVRDGSKKDTCTVSVDVTKDNIVSVTSIRDRLPLTSIVLTQVPYTGFDAGPILTSIFYTLLALWALAVAYIIVIKRGSVFGFSLATLGYASAKSASSAYAYRTATATPSTVSVGTDEEEEEEEEEEKKEEETDEEADTLENRAFAEGVMLSKDALAVIRTAGTSLDEQTTLLDMIVTRAKTAYPRENGWIAIDSERVATLFN